MTTADIIKIGSDSIDFNKPCEVLSALKKMQIRLATGGLRETVRIDGEEVVFQRASDRRLASLIAKYEGECDRANGGRGRKRFAKRFRFG